MGHFLQVVEEVEPNFLVFFLTILTIFLFSFFFFFAPDLLRIALAIVLLSCFWFSGFWCSMLFLVSCVLFLTGFTIQARMYKGGATFSQAWSLYRHQMPLLFALSTALTFGFNHKSSQSFAWFLHPWGAKEWYNSFVRFPFPSSRSFQILGGKRSSLLGLWNVWSFFS